MTGRALELDSPALDAAGQMALDEALLDAARAGQRCLRFYRWAGEAPHGATFGFSQPYAEAEAAARRRGLDEGFRLVRRPTGGGTVFHDGDITFSCVFPWGLGLSPARVYEELHLAVHLLLRERGLDSRPRREPSAPGRGGGECFLRAEPMDLVDGEGRKFLGGALRRRRGFGLYQGSLRPEGLGAPRSELVRALREAFALRWGRPLEREAFPNEVNAAALRLREERYATQEWNHRR